MNNLSRGVERDFDLGVSDTLVLLFFPIHPTNPKTKLTLGDLGVSDTITTGVGLLEVTSFVKAFERSVADGLGVVGLTTEDVTVEKITFVDAVRNRRRRLAGTVTRMVDIDLEIAVRSLTAQTLVESTFGNANAADVKAGSTFIKNVKTKLDSEIASNSDLKTKLGTVGSVAQDLSEKLTWKDGPGSGVASGGSGSGGIVDEASNTVFSVNINSIISICLVFILVSV